MKTRYLYLIYFVISILDIAVVNIAFYITCDYLKLNINTNLNLLIVANYLWLLAALALKLYNAKFIKGIIHNCILTLKSFILFAFIFFSYILLTKENHAFAENLIVFYFFTISGLLSIRYAISKAEKMLKKHFKIARPVAVIGMNSMGIRLAGFFQDQDNHFAFEGFLNKENTSYLDHSGQVLPSILEQIKSAASNGVNDVYVSLSPDKIHEFASLQREADKCCLRLKLVPDLSQLLSDQLKVSYMNNFTVLSNRNEPLEEVENRFQKRAFDIVFSSLVIIFIMSWFYPLVGLLIKLQSPGPILFKQLRSGKNNKQFVCYKFRSMKINNESNSRLTNKTDSRITKIGAFLRKTSLDELPQFFNVFLGDMSVIGPRPHPIFVTEQYSPIINKFMVRHFLKSGITGWAQVNGYRGGGDEENTPHMQKRIEHDIWYLENWSMWLDLKIVYMTVRNLIKGEENAY
ncbi:exopolysaccharide biosynthesis polyprenyl glycosylphosphotransferase [Pedobacter sp. HMF7647]|uniref:Exopolysaccharide biosynthesis polyprenyl glycosylphosphotransferase n=1 Tax=Hufsiella arboris TaxID=2695275 RepID=A0A7K1Y9Q5_9SPHI|nr:exopolysaccharide biosynthesis polyprenyl glycosylphosphotransferase [Hufsiella arboris]MXV51317.1 exopolysaccharide biosynthesis polyprenyl glycosylphosphotransferase [Hufsiella arboris]